MTPVRVIVAEDHPVYRGGLVDVVRDGGFELAGEAETGPQAVEVALREEADVLLLDVQLPGFDGLEVLKRVTAAGVRTQVLFLSASFDGDVVVQALVHGAHGFLTKEAGVPEIHDAIASVAKGQTVLGREVQGVVAEGLRRQRPTGDRPDLTERELEVLRLAASGKTVNAIAEELHLGAGTVKTYLQRTYEKLGVGDRAAAVAEAMRRGLVE